MYEAGEYGFILYDDADVFSHTNEGAEPCRWYLPTIAYSSGKPSVTPAYFPFVSYLKLIRHRP